MKSSRFINTVNRRNARTIFPACLIVVVLVIIARLASASEAQIVVTLNGLNAGDEATVRLLPDGESEAAPALAEQDVANGQNILANNLLNLSDGSL